MSDYDQLSKLNKNRLLEQNENNIVRDITYILSVLDGMDGSSTLSEVLASGNQTGFNDIIITNHRSIFSTNGDGIPTEGYGELFLGDDATLYNRAYLFRSGDSNGDAECGIYTDNKGVVCRDEPLNEANNRVTVYSNDGGVWVKTGSEATHSPVTGEISLEASEGNITLWAENGFVNLNDVGSSSAYVQLDNNLGQAYFGTSESTVISSNGASITINGGSTNSIVMSAEDVTIAGSGDFSLVSGGMVDVASGNGALFIASNNGNLTITPDGSFHLVLQNIDTFADNAAAVTGGVPVNGVYKTASGELRIRV